jgi:chromosome segregation ATPase
VSPAASHPSVAEHQAKAATELATSHHEALAATQAEVSSLKSDLGTAQAKLLELTAEGATLKQQVIKLGRAQARADELEAALAAAKAAAAASEAECKDTVSKVCAEQELQEAPAGSAASGAASEAGDSSIDSSRVRIVPCGWL